MTDEGFASGMALLREVYQSEISAPLAQTYAATLGDLADDVFAAAIMRHIRSSVWMPKPAELRRQAEAVASDRAGLLDAGNAWDRVLTIARRWHPALRTADLMDQTTRAALASIGGIRAVALADDDQVTQLARRFRRDYETAAAETVADVLTGGLGASACRAIEATRLESPSLHSPELIVRGAGGA